MRVGILTFHYADNYGAVLQAYGLQQKVRELGHDVHILDFRYHPPVKVTLTLKRAIARCLNLVQGHRTDHAAHVQKTRRFAEFRAKHLRLSAPLAVDQLPSIADNYDAFIVGSDQVWNAHFWGEPRLAYFLDFCKNDRRVRKISYAACFGQSDQPSYYLRQLDELLSSFDHLSVRGDGGRDLVHEHTRHRPASVVDPTMLWGFDEVMSPPSPYTGCILVYSLSRHMARDINGVAQQLSKAHRQPVVSVTARTLYPFGDQYADGSGPLEFLRLVHDASFLCTESYHGTLCAIKFGVPFVTFYRGQRAMRIRDALTTFGLGERLVRSDDGVNANQLLAKEIDFGSVHQRIQCVVRESVRFLEASLR